MTEEQHLLPTPVIDEPKRRIGNADLDLSTLLKAVEAAEIILNDSTQQITPIGKDAYHNFYLSARELMRNLEPYLVESDKPNFYAIMDDTLEMPNPKLINLKYANAVCRFIKSALKNANLTELGKKDEVPYIMHRVKP